MMRINFVLAGALVAIIVACGGGNGSGGSGADAAAAVCGDGICEASEVRTCVQDCGSPVGPGSGSGSGSGQQAVCGNGICEPGETAESCPSDCAQGSGSGSGVLDCNDDTVQEECLECVLLDMCSGTNINEANCEVCLGD